MTQNPYPGPGFHDFNQPQAGQVAPDAEAKLKRSQIVLLATLGIYVLNSVLSYVLAPSTIEVMGEVVPVESKPSDLVGSIVGIALFFVVYSMMQKRKKSGRITGYVFAGLGIVGALVSAFGGMLISPVVIALSVVWLVLSIIWIIFVSHKSVTSILR